MNSWPARLVAIAFCISAVSCTFAQPTSQPASLDSRYQIGPIIHSDDFKNGLSQWVTELENGGKVQAADGKLEIEVPAGCTVWFKTEITEPVLIEYDATVLKAGGTNDRVSDLNCFWMATDSRSPDGLFDTKRSGKFADYNQLKCYYVGLGGNTNSTTRFRRYIGSPTTRPILPEHDLADAKDMITPNKTQKIQLVACGKLIQYFRDGERIFQYEDANPYTHGWFAFRTTWNHMAVQHFQIRKLIPKN